MIRIQRPPAPEFMHTKRVLIAKQDLEERFSESGRQQRLRFDMSILAPVKETLIHMSHGKCAYCESKLGISNSGEIENFRPKAGARGLSKEQYAPMHYWWLAYEWDNLLLACTICNQKYKRDFFPVENEHMRAPIGTSGPALRLERPLLIDPCLDDPAEHLIFEANGTIRELSQKGKVTLEILGLNRNELVAQRRQVAEQLMDRLGRFNPGRKNESRSVQTLIREIKVLFSDQPTQEYAATLRAVFQQWYERNPSLGMMLNQDNSNDSPLYRSSPAWASSTEEIKITMVEKDLQSIKRFSIKTIEIENFRSIEKITLHMTSVKSEDHREAWLLLLGDNGVGKSSILQAVALALAGKPQLEKLNLDVTDYLRRGTDAGFVRIQSCEHDAPVELHFDKDGFRTDLQEAPAFILAYGSTRLLPKGPIQPDRAKEQYVNIRNIFDYTVALENPVQWLTTIDRSEFTERVAPAFFDVLALKGDDKLWINDGKISIQHYGSDCELEDSSDGYKTIVALVGDMMQTLSIDKANYHNAQGIILIDEIGNHLHPRWRMKIVAALRRAFPKLQFIVSTHEPLCLRGLAHGEVNVLVRDRNNTIQVLDSNILPDHNMMSIEQLLTSDLFGLINVLDEETEKTYEEYYSLLSKKEGDQSEEDRRKIAKMSQILSDKELLGKTSEEQVLYKVISETFAKKIHSEGFKTKETLKAETVQEIKGMINDKKIPWL